MKYPRTVKVGIYTATVGGRVVYVGQAARLDGCAGRWAAHERSGTRLGRTIRKHGVRWDVVWEQERTFGTADEAKAFARNVQDPWEIWLVRSYDTFCVDPATGKQMRGHPGCNLTRGGGGALGNPEPGRKGGRAHVESGHVARMASPESCAKGGQISGRAHVESGHFARIAPVGGDSDPASWKFCPTHAHQAVKWGFPSIAAARAAIKAKQAKIEAKKRGEPEQVVVELAAQHRALDYPCKRPFKERWDYGTHDLEDYEPTPGEPNVFWCPESNNFLTVGD